MTGIEERLAGVPADDLPAVEVAAVRARARSARRTQHSAAALGLAVLVMAMALVARAFLGGGSGQVADGTPTVPDATSAADVRLGTWTLGHPADVTQETTELVIMVEQVNGECGSSFSALDPVITLEEDRIVVRAEGEYTPPEPGVAHTCQGVVSYVALTLPEPIGDRLLVDAFDDGVRWQPVRVGDPATWVLADPTSVTADSTVLELSVTRAACSSGFTGEVYDPIVTFTDSEVLIRTEVEPLGPGAYMCPGNPRVPHTLLLSEPVGDRILVDEICRQEPDSGYAYCMDAGVRWTP